MYLTKNLCLQGAAMDGVRISKRQMEAQRLAAGDFPRGRSEGGEGRWGTVGGAACDVGGGER